MPRRLWTPRPREGDDLPLTQGEGRAYVRRATVAFIGLVLVSSLTAYLVWDAGVKNDQRACRERVDGRITQAQGLDDLRRAALRPGASSRQREAFLAQTQPAIDTQLSRAAGRVVRADPKKALTETVVAPIRRDGVRKCDADGE